MCFLQNVFYFTVKKASIRTLGEQCSVKSHGADMFHPRFIEYLQNTKNRYFSMCLVDVLTKYQADRSNSEILGPDNGKT